MLSTIKVGGLLLAAALASSASLPAHERDRHGNTQNSRFEQGYREGFVHGRQDRDRGLGAEVQSREYRRGDRTYRQGYEQGYRSGYNGRNNGVFGRDENVFGRNGNVYGRNGGVYDRNGGVYDRGGVYNRGGIFNRGGVFGRATSMATDIGYQDGLEKGVNDARQNKSFKPERHDSYKDADHGYDRSYGDKESYKQEYRAAWMTGYREGFSGRRY